MSKKYWERDQLANDRMFVYGRNKKQGYFLQIWKVDRLFHVDAPQNAKSEQNTLVDEGSLTPERLTDLASRYGLEIDQSLFEQA